MDVPENILLKMYLISFMDLFAVGLTFPVLTPYIRSLGVSHLTVGVLSSTYSALQVLSGPIIGSWSDIRGRKSVFVITLLLSSIFYFLLGLSSSVISIFVVRLLLGLVKHTQTLNKAIVADYTESENNSKIFGRTAAYSSVGFVIGPVIGGHLMDTDNGFMYICTITAFLFILNIGLVLSLPDDDTKKHSKQSEMDSNFIQNVTKELSKSIQDVLKVDWKKYWVPLILKFLFVLSTTIFFTSQSIYLKESYNLPQKYVGYAISIISIIGVVTSYYLGALSNLIYGPNKSIDCALHSFMITTGCFICFYYEPSVSILAALFVPFGICNAALRIVTMGIMFDKCVDGDRGTLTGASDSVMSLGRFVAPLTAGIFSHYFSHSAVMLFATAVSLLGVIICHRVRLTISHDKVE